MTPVEVQPWLALDPRMLLVHPIREVVRFLPVILGALIAGRASGNAAWALLGVAVPVLVGIVRYVTTSYRIGADRVELRRGLVQRHTLVTPIDRVRTVDLTATLAHRALGLATVVIGTGSVATDADERLELDGLPRAEAAALRVRLLRAADRPGADLTEPDEPAAPAAPVVRFRTRWLWYAPFTSAGLVAAGAFAGAVAQAVEVLDVGVRVDEDDVAAVTGVLVLGALAGAAVLAILLTVAGYLVVNGGFALAREHGAWHIRRGLLTTRETSIDESRLAGVSRAEPAALRLARGARLSAIVTGLARSRDGAATLVPPAPRATVEKAATAVLGTPSPMTAPLRPHGPAAVRRRYSRALLGSLPFVLLLAGAVAAGLPAWALAGAVVPVGCALALAHDRSRSLGHALVDGFVVTRSGSLQRRRDALAAGHVIGWTFRDTWFQRRAGLVSFDATTAGGRGRVGAPDAPPADAVALADAATPGLLAQFLRPST